MKRSLKFLLAQLMLLMGGYAQLSAASFTTHPQHKAGHSGNSLVYGHGPQTTVTRLTNPEERCNERLFENEEDDENVSFKKHLKNGNYFISFFFAPTGLDLMRLGTTELTFTKTPAPVTLPSRHIVLQVFRI